MGALPKKEGRASQEEEDTVMSVIAVDHGVCMAAEAGRGVQPQLNWPTVASITRLFRNENRHYSRCRTGHIHTPVK